MLTQPKKSPVASSPKPVQKHVLHARVLCIDDDPSVAEGLHRNFRNEGIETLLAYHGTQGYWLACTEKPDIIVIDLRMPGGNGEDVIQSLKQNALTRHIPIIVLSGAQEYGIKQRAFELGVDCFLEKPANFADLLQKVTRLM
jgi:DNA-binding response OmpR family regulator